ncbi:MAG TPA: hypothetical protein VJ793_19145 [Anaerolineae bacterium]|nr:hypothetical protein [Anaerolineae bacterium]
MENLLQSIVALQGRLSEAGIPSIVIGGVAVAIETHCAFIVSGDRHLLDLSEYRGVRILSPRDFLTLLATHPTRAAGNEV